MFLDVHENKDNTLICEIHNCNSVSDVFLELIGEEGMYLCRRHCYNTLKNLGAKESVIEVLKK